MVKYVIGQKVMVIQTRWNCVRIAPVEGCMRKAANLKVLK
jgi:hypothetical protein